MNNKSILFRYCRQHSVYIVFLVLAVLINGFLSTFPVKLIEKLIDSSTENSILQGVVIWGGIYLTTQILWVLTGGLVSLLSTNLEIKIGHQIRTELFEKIEHLPVSFFDQNTTSDMLIRLVEDSSITVDGILKPIIFLSLNIVQFLLGFYFISTISFKVALLMIPIGLVLIFLSVRSGSRIRSFSIMQRKSVEELWNKFMEGIKSIKVLKAFLKEDQYYRQVEEASRNVCHESEHLEKYKILIDRLYSSLFMILIAFIMVYGSVQVKLGVLSIGGLSALMMYNGILIDPMLNFFEFYQQLQQIMVSSQKIFHILNLPDEDYRTDGDAVEEFQKNIIIRDLDFAYTDRKVLQGIDMTIRKGQHIAFVGLSGAGKSTLYDLLMGFYPVEKGHIFMDGTDIMQLKVKDIRKLFGIVFQDTNMMNGTIRANLQLVKEDAEDAEICEALRMAGLKDLLTRLQEGIDSPVGDDGSNLSGGERQRLSLARAFLVHPQILILDEAMSALDTITSRQITENIFEQYKENTVIFTVHKLEGVVEQCDEVFVFDSGRLLEHGTHEELLGNSDIYRQLYCVGR